MVRSLVYRLAPSALSCLVMASAAPKHDVTIADLAALRLVNGLAISADAKQIAYRLAGDIYVIEAAAHKTPRKIGAGSSPSFSPDGNQLAYYGTSGTASQLFEAQLRSVVAKTLSTFEEGLVTTAAPAWSL